MGEYAFDADSRVSPSGADGEFSAVLTGRWNGMGGAVNGGYMLATCTRALGLIAPFPDPIVISGFFLRPGTAGPAVIRASLVRSGRTTAFGEAVLTQSGKEIVRAAGQTGAHMHYCHVNSTSQRHIDRVLGLVGRAQEAGARISTEAYPYGSGMTAIGAAFLAPERLGERGLVPSSLTYAPTGERVASETRLRELRRTNPGGLAIIELLNENDEADRRLLMRSLTFPGAVIASDAMPLTTMLGS